MQRLQKILFILSFLLVGFGTLSTRSSFFVHASSDDLYNLLYPSESKTISMDFKGASLTDVLKVFSQQSGMNFIASSEVSDKTVTLYLDNVPVEQALERILTANELTYELDATSNIFVVKKLEKSTKKMMTRVYHLKYATVSSSKLLSTLGSSTSSSSESSGTSSGSSSTSGTTGTGSGLIAAVQTSLSEKGSIVEEARTNSLIVTDYPSQFPEIEATLARLDVRIPQILIEAEMLDISKASADLLGAKWGDSPVALTNGGTKQDTFPFNYEILEKNGYTFATPQYTTSKISFEGLKFTLQFLRTQTDTRNLARPRILTLNNEIAKIEITTDEVIGVTSTQSVAGTLASNTNNQAERYETGVFLSVTPQANVDTGEITMAIEPKVIEARRSKFDGDKFRDPEQRLTKSILRVLDGDTIVIAGLLRTDVSETVTRVPGISSIPLIGNAFKHKDKNETQRELVVFITPHIIKEDGIMSSKMKSLDEEIIREQDVPTQRSKKVARELSSLEKTKR